MLLLSKYCTNLTMYYNVHMSNLNLEVKTKERIDKENGKYTIKSIYKDNAKQILSSIINYDGSDRELNGTVFIDTEYSKELYSYEYKYFDDGSYEQKVKSKDNVLGSIATGYEHFEKYYSVIVNGSNSNINFIKYFENNDFSKILVEEEYKYNRDSSYEIWQNIYRYTDDGNIDYDYSYSKINYYNKQALFYSYKAFDDLNFKKHSFTYSEESSNEDVKIESWSFEDYNPSLYGAKSHASRKEYYYKDGREKEELFSDKDFTNLIATIHTTHINDDKNIITVKGIGEFESNDINYKSFTQDYNKSSCVAKYYKDTDFTDLLFSEITNEITDKKLAIVKTIYEPKCNKPYLSQIAYYSFDNNTRKTEYFEDNNFQKLYII